MPSPIANLSSSNTFGDQRAVINQIITLVNQFFIYGNLNVNYVLANTGTFYDDLIVSGIDVANTLNASFARANASFSNVYISANTSKYSWNVVGNDTIYLATNSKNTVSFIAGPGITLYVDNVNTAIEITTGAFAEANTANATALLALQTANSGSGNANVATALAISAFNQANSAYSQANLVYGQANSAYAQANLVYGQANTAYNEANTANVIAANALPLSGGTMTGQIKMNFNPIQQPILAGYGEIAYSNANVSSNLTLNLAANNIFSLNLSANVYLTLINPLPAGNMSMATIILTQNGASAVSATIQANTSAGAAGSINYQSGVAPIQTTFKGRTDVLQYWTVSGGTLWYGSQSLANT